ncbi:TonB-dependent receptor [Psychroserpens algicola]|uniref:TonB-dependent receptor n=1 Tax=Psychroserpens algicola TaxID=1719034 RepID=A0ABT0H8U7_9FLAO|nr:TonB-dependent receptor [Psychroserpens algicola]MCK8480277.1 TonB-dependent receptor [Psychroserpens algicola]
MKKSFFIILFGMFSLLTAFAQDTIVKGSVLDGTTGEPIPDVTITIEETSQSVTTDSNGEFQFNTIVPLGEQVLRVEKQGYVTKRYPIVVNEGQTVDISGMTLNFDSDKSDSFVISISDDNLNSEDDGLTDNISGLLQASRDQFLSAAAFDFSATFFRPRGLDNANGKVLINGIEMNKQFSGRPQWGNWGGLNDVQRNQEFSMGMSANDYSFGDLAGTNNIVMRASRYREGGRVSYASANRSYTGRIMASYNSGILEGGWSYSVLASRRYGDEGYVDGTLYDSNSFFAAVEKKINDKHSINFTGIYAQNRRGRSTAITDEVLNLKGRQYNPFWGTQDGEARNSRVREIEEPILMLNHFWDISSKTKLNTNIAYQFGKIGNTRIDNGGTRLVNFNGQASYLGGARNPDPSYYQNLPSYHLRDENPTSYDYEQAFLAERNFRNDGQLDWDALYSANATVRAQGGNSIYAIQEDRNDDSQFTINSILDTELSDRVRLNAMVSYRKLKSENFANLKDLLGGTGYLDVDFFAEEDSNVIESLEDVAQSDLRNPNRIVQEGDRYKYNYEIDANVVTGFAQAQFKYNKVDFYVGANISQTTYQRNGLFENGNFSGSRSFGKSEKLDFSNYGIKAGATYKVTGRHLIDVNASYFTKAPTIRNSFSNARQNNDVVIGLESEQIQSVDASYIFRSPIVKARLTGFYSGFSNGTDIGFFFTEDLAGLGLDTGDAFVQEVLTNVEKRHIGAELGIEAQVTPTIKLKAAASVGQYTFNNNPNLYLTSDDFDGPLTFGDGTTNIKDYHVAGGPERAYQIGFEYRDPDFWNVGLTTNYFSNAYIDVSNLARSSNFTTDFDGQPIVGYDEDIARELLKQEQFDDYILVNVVGGKSWRVGDYFVGFFATINNIFNQEYKTGGFEQSRLPKYDRLLEDQSRDNGPVFGSRYFNGNGTTYYLNVYLRF